MKCLRLVAIKKAKLSSRRNFLAPLALTSCGFTAKPLTCVKTILRALQAIVGSEYGLNCLVFKSSVTARELRTFLLASIVTLTAFLVKILQFPSSLSLFPSRSVPVLPVSHHSKGQCLCQVFALVAREGKSRLICMFPLPGNFSW